MRRRPSLAAGLLLLLFLAASASVQASQQTLYTFDANGNLASKTEAGVVWTYTYDARDLLTQVRRDGVLVEVYRYDFAGRRIRKVGSEGVVQYVWDGDRILLETDGAGNTIAKYEYGDGRLLSLDHISEGRSFHLFDALGTPTVVIDELGEARERIRFDAWGVDRGRTGDSANRFGLTGHELDLATGLYYVKARFLDPALGRFLTEDPVEGSVAIPPSLHRYQYAYQNPTTFWDPDGRAVEVTAIGPGQQVTKELNGQELYELLVRSGIDRRQAESYVVQEGLSADIGADRIPALAASVTAHVDANLEWVAKEGTKIAVATAVGGGGATLAGASRLGIAMADALAGVAYQGTEDALERRMPEVEDYLLAAATSAAGGALVRGAGGGPRPRVDSYQGLGAGGRASVIGQEVPTAAANQGDLIVAEGSDLGRRLIPARGPVAGSAAEQRRDAAGRFLPKAAEEMAPGASRALRVERRLEHWFGPDAVQREQYLRLASGQRAIDPVTGKARRLDLVVVKDREVRASVEVTSRTAGKVAQAARELRIRRAGGTYIKDRGTGDLLDLSKVHTRIMRVK